MDIIVAGTGVSMDKLDIAVWPSIDVFATRRDAAGLDALVARHVERLIRRLHDEGVQRPRFFDCGDMHVF